MPCAERKRNGLACHPVNGNGKLCIFDGEDECGVSVSEDRTVRSSVHPEIKLIVIFGSNTHFADRNTQCVTAVQHSGVILAGYPPCVVPCRYVACMHMLGGYRSVALVHRPISHQPRRRRYFGAAALAERGDHAACHRPNRQIVQRGYCRTTSQLESGFGVDIRHGNIGHQRIRHLVVSD